MTSIAVTSWLTWALFLVGALVTTRLLFLLFAGEAEQPFANLSRPDGICPVCGHQIPVRRGQLVEHGTINLTTNTRHPCPGSRQEAP